MNKIAIILFLFLIDTNTIYSKLSEEYINSKKILTKIDFYFEKLEMNLIENKSTDLCLFSGKASNLIEKNLIKLNMVEPYYHWQEINNLLKSIAKETCQTDNNN